MVVLGRDDLLFDLGDIDLLGLEYFFVVDDSGDGCCFAEAEEFS